MDENLKQPLLVAAIAFSWAAMAYQWIFNMGLSFSYGKLLIATGIGVVAGAIAFFAARMMSR
jgi:hypothetical protein